jgi:ClpX C4-type zinc finger
MVFGDFHEMVMKKQGVSRRRFLTLCGGGMTGIWLVGTGMVRLPDTVVFAMSGSCSFCGKEAHEIFGLVGVTYRNVRICDECVNLCLEIIVEEIGIKPRLAAWAEPDAASFEESVYDPKLLAQLVRRLAAGERGNRLIDALATAIDRSDDAVIVPPRSGFQIECSFCDKPEREDMTMVAGPTAYICDGCIGDAGALFMRYGWRPRNLKIT